MVETTKLHHVVIVGGGFAGLYAAKSLAKAAVKVTLIDKRNFHLFQPLLYQVATGTVSPADISSPLRSILSQNLNTQVLLDEVVDLDPNEKQLVLKDSVLSYDSLIMATGVSHHYFGNDQWKGVAPGLKTVEDALEMRRRIFNAFEMAEKETDPERRQAWMTFVIVGGGPTGVELAGAIAELAKQTLKEDFRNIDTTQAKVLLIEGLDRVLPPYDPSLSAKAQESLERLGVTVLTQSMVTNITDESVTFKQGDSASTIGARTILWAAGVKASAMGAVVAERTGSELDRVGRVIVEADFSVPNYPDIFVVGDLANYAHQPSGKPIPGVAPAAMQTGEYVAKRILSRIRGEAIVDFKYADRGSMAIIGQNEAVVDLKMFNQNIKFTGPIAWFAWLFAHIYYLIEFDNKLVVMTQWAWNYITSSRGARIITGPEGEPTETADEEKAEARV